MTKIKVVGYAKKTYYNGNIEYRPFSPDLVGQQAANTESQSILTNNNFLVTTNLEPKFTKDFKTNKFSKFYSLNSLGDDNDFISTFFDKNKIRLNLDKTKLTNYAYFGSLSEYIRVTLEDIIINWPASIYVNPNIYLPSGNTVTNYTFDSITNKATFYTDINFFDNKYDIKFLKSDTLLNQTDGDNILRNLSINYSLFEISGISGSYPVVGYTGSTYNTNDYVYFITEGNPFSAYSGTNFVANFHIKPQSHLCEQFFKTLNDLGTNLLNRQTYPKYTSIYSFPVESDNGNIIYSERALTWTTDDGYNLDFDNSDYTIFASTLLEIATKYDEIDTDLIVRFLVSESITNFDTISINEDSDVEASAKISKTLRIYGREFDEIKKYIDGIKYVNTVTYDKRDNTPDLLIKNIAKLMGWEVVDDTSSDSIITDLVNAVTTPTSGQTIGLTKYEAEVELWRRLIMNTPWLWKSKGTRKSVEFLLKFMGIPDDLVRFNEYVYVADAPINMEILTKLLEKINGTTSLEGLVVDSEGYPKPLPNNENMWFQKGGMWYRETGGNNSVVHINNGNNPHAGPYDWGNEYINQFSKGVIPNFSPTTIYFDSITTGTTNLFINYSSGTMNTLAGTVIPDNEIVLIRSNDSSSISDCVTMDAHIVDDPMPTAEKTLCGCTSEVDDDILKINVEKIIQPQLVTNCVYDSVEYNSNGFISVVTSNVSTDYLSTECCTSFGGVAIYDSGVNAYKCKWNN